MADIDSQASFSVMTESGEMRSMTPEEINAFVRQQIELASSRKNSPTPTQQTRRMRLARTPSPLSRFGRTNPLLHQTIGSKSSNLESIRTDLSLDESLHRATTTTPRDVSSSTSLHSPPHLIQHNRPTLSSTGLVQSKSRAPIHGSMEDEKRSLSVDRHRQSISPDRRDGIEEKRDCPLEIDFDSDKTHMEKYPYKKSELRIEIFPTSPKKAAPSPEYSGAPFEGNSNRPDEPALIRRRSPSQTERKLRKAARNKASRRRADLFTATRNNAFDSEPFDENDQYSQISDTQASMFDSSMDVSQKTHGLLKDTSEITTQTEKKQLMSQPEIDMLIKHSINKARQARKIATSESERNEKHLKDFEPKSRFDELTGMSPRGSKNRRFSWSSVEDMDDASTLDGAKSPKAALEVNGKHDYRERNVITSASTARSGKLATWMRFSSPKSSNDQIARAGTEVSSAPREVVVPGSSVVAREDSKILGKENVNKRPEGLTISTAESSPLDFHFPLNIPSITGDRIYSQDEISAIVMLSMEKAQQAARNEIRSLLLTPKATDPKSPIAAKLAARLRVPSQEEVTLIAREAMHRAREAAQDEIRTLIRESFRCAQDSSQEQIRQIVRDAMQRARASAREEMSELVRNILRQGIDTQTRTYHRAVISKRNPDMIAAENLLVSKSSAIDSCAPTISQPNQSYQPKLESPENVETEDKQKESEVFFPSGTEQIGEDNGGENSLSADSLSKNSCEHKLTPSISKGEKSLVRKPLGVDRGRTPKTKFSFSQVDTQDDDLALTEPPNKPAQNGVSPNHQFVYSQDTQGRVSHDDNVSPGNPNFTSVKGDGDVRETAREPDVGNYSLDQTTGASVPLTKQLEEDASGNHIFHRSLLPENIDNQDALAIEDGNREDKLQHYGGTVSVVECMEKNNAFEAFAVDTSMIALSDGPSLSLSVQEEAPVESDRKSERPTERERESTKHRRKSRASRTRYMSGVKSPLSSMSPSDSSCSLTEDIVSTTSSVCKSRRKSRKNRYRSSKNEAVVTDEFLQLIASKKGKRITAKDLGELIKQQQISSLHSKNDSRLRKRTEIRGPHNFQARPHLSFEKQPRFCMVGNFMNFWEDLDLFLDESGSEYQGNELLSFSTREGSYTEFEYDDIEESFTEEARFDPNIAVSFSLHQSEEDESFVSEEDETPQRRGWW